MREGGGEWDKKWETEEGRARGKQGEGEGEGKMGS